MDSAEWKDLRARLRFEVQERPNDRVLQYHRNEWPRLWAVIDEIIAWDDEKAFYDEEDSEEKDLPPVPLPETPVEATLDDDDQVETFETRRSFMEAEAGPDDDPRTGQPLKDFDLPDFPGDDEEE